MTNTLQKLATKKLIKVEPDPLSGRKKRVTITEKGRLPLEQAIMSTTPLFAELSHQLIAAKVDGQLPLLPYIREPIDQFHSTHKAL